MARKAAVVVILLTLAVTEATASNLANPVTLIPEARVGIGASYCLGGHTITNREIRSLLNRFHGRVTYAPLSFLNIGVDLGASQMSVAADTSAADTIGVFNGKYAFSFGGHLKVGTPLLRDIVGGIGIAQVTRFSSRNDYKARYGGFDINGALGAVFHIPKFGFAAIGPKAYLIRGENESHDGRKGQYGNVNNLRGWVAVDYFPRLTGEMKNRPYISLEVSLSPDAGIRDNAPAEFEFSITFGTVTARLYGEVSEVDWEP